MRGPVGPLVAQREAAAAADVDREQRAGHRVEAGGEHDRVELVLARRRRAGRSAVIASIGVSRRSTSVDVGAVERLEVAGVDADALACRADGRRAAAARRRPGRVTRLADLRRGRTRRACSFASRSSKRSVKAPSRRRSRRVASAPRNSRSRSSGVDLAAPSGGRGSTGMPVRDSRAPRARRSA